MEDPRARRHIGEIVERRYLVDRLVGEGSFAWVYHALDKSGRDVAVKVLHSEDPSAGLRFAREVRVLKALPQNEHVAGYVDEGRSRDGKPLLVLDYVDGITLKRGMEGRPKVAPRKAVSFLAELCEAFVGLHQLGVAHRDVKPENILLARSGGIKLIDFGLIRDAQGILQLLEAEEESLGERVFAAEMDAGVLAGTPEYMAPEQFADAATEDLRKGRTDTSSDVFSLGVILFQLLTGAKPFPMEDVTREDYPRELLRYFDYRVKLKDEDLPPLPGMSPALSSIVHKALRADPRRRQPDARAFQEDLHRYLGTGRGVTDSDDAHTVSVAVDEILRPDSTTEEIEIAPPMSDTSPWDAAEVLVGEPDLLYEDSEEEEITAVRDSKRRKRIGALPARRGGSHTSLFFQQDIITTVSEEETPDIIGTSPMGSGDVVPTEIATAPELATPPTDSSMQPGPRRPGPDADGPEPPTAPTPTRPEARRRSKKGKKSKKPSIFEQDTRRVNVAEILPDEVKDPDRRQGE